MGALKSRDPTTRHHIARVDIARLDNAEPDQTDRNWLNIRRPRKKNRSCLTRFDNGAYSRLQFLRAVSHSVGAHTESLHPRVDNSSNSSEDEDEDRQAPMLPATTSGASESATAAAATTSDDCCEVCIVALRRRTRIIQLYVQFLPILT